ncbi:hypothetical protein GCM10010363_08790 [Streptomyces omiyaensis]|nr:hypothetical protein GCM10010363_08790 [Streptomyces omiyaensis]
MGKDAREATDCGTHRGGAAMVRTEPTHTDAHTDAHTHAHAATNAHADAHTTGKATGEATGKANGNAGPEARDLWAAEAYAVLTTVARTYHAVIT